MLKNKTQINLYLIFKINIFFKCTRLAVVLQSVGRLVSSSLSVLFFWSTPVIFGCCFCCAFVVGLLHVVAFLGLRLENFHLGSNQACTIEIQISNSITHS